MSLAGADPGLPRVSLPQAAIASWLGLGGPALGHWGCQLLAEASGAPCTARRYWTPRPHHMTRSWPRQLDYVLGIVLIFLCFVLLILATAL